MNAGHAHVIERLNPTPHHLRCHSRFFCDRNIRGAGCNYQDMSPKPQLGVTDRHDARLVMIDRSMIKPFNERGHLASRARRQQRAMMFQQGLRNGANLGRRLPLAENDLGKPLP